MAESESSKWSLIPRLIVAAGAAMVVALAAKPYEGKIRPYLESVKKVRFEVPKSDSALTPENGKSRPQSQKKRDNITEGDRSELEAVLNHL